MSVGISTLSGGKAPSTQRRQVVSAWYAQQYGKDPAKKHCYALDVTNAQGRYSPAVAYGHALHNEALQWVASAVYSYTVYPDALFSVQAPPDVLVAVLAAALSAVDRAVHAEPLQAKLIYGYFRESIIYQVHGQ